MQTVAANAGSKKLMLNYRECMCVSFKLTDYGKSLTRQIGFDDYEYNFNVSTAVLEPERLIRVRLDINIFDKTEKSVKVEIGEMQTINGVVIINFDDVIKKTKEKSGVSYDIPYEVMKILVGYSISASRGMLSTKMENTLFSNAIIPFIDPNTFFQSTGTFG